MDEVIRMANSAGERRRKEETRRAADRDYMKFLRKARKTAFRWRVAEVAGFGGLALAVAFALYVGLIAPILARPVSAILSGYTVILIDRYFVRRK